MWEKSPNSFPGTIQVTNEKKNYYKRLSGLTVWSFESTRYLGARENVQIRNVKHSVSVKLLPTEPFAPQTFQQLRYTVAEV